MEYTNTIEILEKEKAYMQAHAGREQVKAFDIAIKSVKKHIPIKPRIETTKDVPKTHNYGRLLCFYCPTCGRNLVNIYETDPLRGGGVHRDLNGCMKCLQAIDFEQWKHKEESEELKLED